MVKFYRTATCITAIMLLFSACNGNKSNTKDAIPLSNGLPGEVSIVIDHSLEDEIAGVFDKVLDMPMQGIKPAEPAWLKLYVTPEESSAEALTMAQMIIVKRKKAKNKNVSELWDAASSKAVQRDGFLVAHDVWANPQSVVLIEADDATGLDKAMQAGKGIVSLLNTLELERGLFGGLSDNRYSDSVMKRVENDFGFRFPLPPQYKLQQSNHEMLWFIWEGKDFRNNIFINIVPDTEPVTTAGMTALRDTFGRRYIHGSMGTSMITSRSEEYPLMVDSFITATGQLPAWKGWWTIGGEWQRGSFHRILFHDKAGKRYVFFEGFLEAPNVPNVPYYRLYSIMASHFRFSTAGMAAQP
jgi:hypothetical protein